MKSRNPIFSPAILAALVVSASATFAWADTYDSAVQLSLPDAYWRLDEPALSPTAIDATGNGNDGTYIGFGAGDYSQPGLITPPNGAAHFNGGGSNYLTGPIPATTFANDWTIEGWFSRNSMQQWAGIFSNNAGASGAPLMTMIENSNAVGINGAGVTAENVSIDLRGPSFNEPVYAVITKTGGNLATQPTFTVHANVGGVWLNPVTGSNTAWSLTPQNNFYIGRHYDGAVQNPDGKIDEVAVYSRALSPAEIQSHYVASGNAVKGTELVIDNNILGGATLTDAKYTESGTFSDVTNGSYGNAYWNLRDNYRIAFNAGDKAIYTPGVTGAYDVQVAWPVHPAHDTQAVYRVTDANGVITNIPINQGLSAAQGAVTGAPAISERNSGWFTLGKFDLNGASKIELIGSGVGGVLAADAIRVADTGRIIDEWSANVSYSIATTGPHHAATSVAGVAPGADASTQYAWNPDRSATVTYTSNMPGLSEISLSWAVHTNHAGANYTLDLDGINGNGDELLLATINQHLASDQLHVTDNQTWSGWYRVPGQYLLTSNSKIYQTFGGIFPGSGDPGDSFSTDALLIKSVVPEPATFVLALVGGIAAWGVRRRRGSKSAK